MKKYIAPLCILVLLLTGCEREEPVPTMAPTSGLSPDPGETAAEELIFTRELNVERYGRTFWLELVRTGEPGELRVDVYETREDPEPFQSFIEWSPIEWSPEYQVTELKGEDVDFDGYTDFHFVINTEPQYGEYSSYYVWDPDAERFVPDPYGLNALSNGSFSSYHKEVSSYAEGGKRRDLYQYENSRLVWVGEEYIPEEDPSRMYVRRRVRVDEDHTFLVELVPREGDYGDIWVNIYRDGEDREPVQQFEDRAVSFRTIDLRAEDVDFDGKTDFHFVRDYGSLPGQWTNYYIWDPAKERFLPDPYGLNELPYSEFDGERQTIYSYWNDGKQEYYRYIDGKLSLAEERFSPGEDGEEKAYKAKYVTVDEAHTFWVKLVDTGQYGTLQVNIYKDQTDREPIQTLEGSCETSVEFLYIYIEDMDFDGYGDLAVLYSDSPNGHAAFSYYIWDEKEERFLPDPYGLNGLFSVGLPDVLPEEQMVRTSLRWGAGSEGEIRYYRYLEEGFTCVRRMYWCWHEGGGVDFHVEDYEDGEMRTVYKETCSTGDLGESLWSEEFSNWYDPEYRGKQ